MGNQSEDGWFGVLLKLKSQNKFFLLICGMLYVVFQLLILCIWLFRYASSLLPTTPWWSHWCLHPITR